MPGRATLALAGTLLFTVAPPAREAPAPGAIEGTVREAGGGPLAGARVSVVGTPQGATTGADGRYRIDGVAAGRVTLAARHAGHADVRRVVEVGGGRVTRADFALVPATAQEKLADAGRRLGPVRAASAHPHPYAVPRDFNTEEYRHIAENGWRSPRQHPLSTFSADVDAASYSNVRRLIGEGRLPPADAVRIEELINYFRYGYPDPDGTHPVSVTTELGEAPWAPGHRLALVGLRTRALPVSALPPANLVFLIDVSGSMQSPDKLPLVKAAFRLLVNELRPQDRVAIVVYAGAAGLVLPSTPGDRKDRILDALAGLEAGGSTAGGAGIQLAYQVAREHFLREGNNRVILATDGDFNVGPSSEGELVRMIEARRRDGVFLTVLGFGRGNLKDARMEQLANRGNGHYAYIDNLLEARKVFVQELGATLLTVAKDVKLQVEFNPARVAAYRLVGYENRLLNDEDFNDDAKDAGDLGAGHMVTALYEIVPVGVASAVRVGGVDPLRFQDAPAPRAGGRDWLAVKVRYQPPAGGNSRLLERLVRSEAGSPSADFRFAAAVAQFGMLLRSSEHRGRASWDGVLAQARGALGEDPEGYRAEFLRLVAAARLLDTARAGGPE
jgi:Ca-activated chloride channel homolog